MTGFDCQLIGGAGTFSVTQVGQHQAEVHLRHGRLIAVTRGASDPPTRHDRPVLTSRETRTANHGTRYRRCRIDHNRRSRKSLKEIREAVSDRGRGVRSRGERPPAMGAPNHRR